MCVLCLFLQVHKILLAATSDYFRVMLQGPMRESQEHFVDLKSLTADALQQIVDFMYSGEMTLQFDNLEEILNAANHLQVRAVRHIRQVKGLSLQRFVKTSLCRNFTDTNNLLRNAENESENNCFGWRFGEFLSPHSCCF